jgi:DNA-binding transcriptional LysR family regulator
VSANTIRFSATHSLSLNFFPGWLRSIEMRSHTFNTRLDTVQFQECIQMLLRGDCHFVISYTHAAIAMNLPAEHFVGKVVLMDRLVPVTLPDTSGEPIDRLPGTEDEPVHYLAYTETSAIGRVVEQLIANMDEPVHLNRVFVSHMAAVLKPMSSEGRGTAWLPESHIQKDLEEGSLVLAGDEKWFIPIDIRLIRSKDPLPMASEEFWSLIETEEDSVWG